MRADGQGAANGTGNGTGNGGSANSGRVRIIGIDPGLRRTGWGVIETDGVRLSYVASGTATSDAECCLADRLVQLYRQLALVIADQAPHEAAVEETFVNKDARATLKLGQARGIALLAPAMAGLPVAEYAPNQIKKTVIGAGHGDKAQIAAMIGFLLPRAAPQTPDEADALAIAICHAHHRRSARILAAASATMAATAGISATTKRPAGKASFARAASATRRA